MRLLYTAALSLAAPYALAGHFTSVPGKFDCPQLNNSLACARSIEKSLDVPFVSRDGNGKLDIELADGGVHAFVDVDAAGGEALHYSVLETIGDNRYVVIHRQFHEGSGFGLLDRESGTFTEFRGYPAFSPDGRWLVVAHGDVNAGVLQIFDATGTSFRLSFDASPSTWWPARVEWTSATSLAYERLSFPAQPDHGLMAVKAEVHLDGRTWRPRS